jgi:predicted naringenin-chalcone synthase
MSLSILGIGTALPTTRIDQEQAALIASQLCCQSDEHRTWLPLMYQQTGIRHRRLQMDRSVVRDILEGTSRSGSVFVPAIAGSVNGPTTGQRMTQYADFAGPLAVQAAEAALNEAGLRGADITHLITVSCTGFQAPGVDFELIRRLGLPSGVARTHVGFMGCHAALNGLRVAGGFTGSDPSARVLMCATELCSLHYHYGWDPQQMVANALFADGAAAVVGAPVGSAGAWRLAAHGSSVIPDSADAMTWTVGNHGFSMTLSKKVPELIGKSLRPWLVKWLRTHHLDLTQINSWAVHPGGPKILDVVEDVLELGRGALVTSREVFADYGNMSSPTVVFILDRLRRERARLPCVALGFGPGMAVEAALVTSDETAG